MLLRLGVALVPFWDVRGYLSEGRRWLATGLAASPQAAVPDGLRARALIGTGRLGFWLADREYPLRPFQEALELARSLGDESALAEAVTWLGAARGLQGEWPVAEELLQEGLRRHQALAEAWGSAWALLQLGRVAANAGVYSLKPELVVRARTLLEDSLQRFRSLGDRRSSGIACLLLAFSVAQGNPRRAPRLLREALDELMAVGDRAYVWIGLQSGAQILARAGQPVYAARLLGAAEGLQEAVGALLPPVGQVEVAATRALIHARLGDERLDAALCEGRRTWLEAVIAEVRAAADAVIAPLPPPAARPVVSDDLAARRQGYG
jgi:tetratricopeptide (TPR) repeat protein